MRRNYIVYIGALICWKGHNQDAWDKVKAEAVQQAETYFNQNQNRILWLRSRSSRTEKAQKNAQNAGVAHLIQWKQGDVAALKIQVQMKWER